jgi:hypothetical protein
MLTLKMINLLLVGHPLYDIMWLFIEKVIYKNIIDIPMYYALCTMIKNVIHFSKNKIKKFRNNKMQNFSNPLYNIH